MTDSASTGATELAQLPETSIFETEILSQPDALRDAITLNLDPLRASMALVSEARRLRLVGSGIEYFVAEAGAWMIREVGITATADRAYDLAAYPTGFQPGDLIVAISNHAPDPYIVATLRRTASSGLKSIVITSSGVLVDADATIETGREERSNFPSISITQPLAVLAAIAARFEPHSSLASAVPTLPETMRSMMPTREVAAEVANEIITNNRRVLVTGAGQMHPVARLGALSYLASSHRNVNEAHTHDVLLGGLQLLRSDDVLVQIAPDGASNNVNSALRREADERKLKRWKIGGQVDNAHWNTRLPEIPEEVTALHAIVPIQWLALETALLQNQRSEPDSTDDNQLTSPAS